MKVNHAGEHGAVNIYAGQILVARLLYPSLVDQLLEFQRHETRHRSIFETELTGRGRLRCRSYYLCGLGGYVLGILSALLGKSAIAATTVAVEQVVLGHLNRQVADLQEVDRAAVTAIRAIQADEQSHHDLSADQIRSTAIWTRVLRPIVSSATEAVIWLGMKL
jgi:3-demethoxyubiquinol 3-hydroxylase